MKKIDCVNQGNNIKNHTCILFIQNIKKSLELSNITISDYVNTMSTEKINVKIENEDDVYNFYLENNEDGKITNKTETSVLTGLHVEKIRRMNNILKEKNLIETKGKNIYLMQNNLEGRK